MICKKCGHEKETRIRELNEKLMTKMAYRAVADGSWEGKLNFRMPIQQVVELKPIIDYAVKCICATFGTPAVPSKEEITNILEEVRCHSEDHWNRAYTSLAIKQAKALHQRLTGGKD